MTKKELSNRLTRWRKLLAKAQGEDNVVAWRIYLLNYARDLGDYANCLPKDGA